MGDLRKDYILDRWTLLSATRKKRPHDFKKKKISKCVFCPGNEKLTPKETYRINGKEGWIIRCFYNKFPAVTKKKSKLVKKNKFIISKGAYGVHEVIADSRDHNKQLWDKSVDHIKILLEVFCNRIKHYRKLKGIKYIAIFKNHGLLAGTTIKHSHCQLIAYNKLPRTVEEESEAHKKNSYCKVIDIERKSKRKIFENKTAICLAPFASRFNYEVIIFPKRYVNNIVELNDNELYDLAEIIKRILLSLKKINAPFNLYLHDAPAGKNLHFHIKINPRMNIHGGFELETGDIILTVSPEDAAKFYKKNGVL